jgi:hypothetical protein
MTKNIIIGVLICFVSILGITIDSMNKKESLEVENLEHQLEYERTMHSIDSCEQMKLIQNYESLIQIIQK